MPNFKLMPDADAKWSLDFLKAGDDTASTSSNQPPKMIEKQLSDAQKKALEAERTLQREELRAKALGTLLNRMYKYIDMRTPSTYVRHLNTTNIVYSVVTLTFLEIFIFIF